MVDQALQPEPWVIIHHGRPEAVVLGVAEWERLPRGPSYGRLLMKALLKAESLPARAGWLPGDQLLSLST